MHFLADESCDFAIVRSLRAEGHDIETVADIMQGAEDEEVCEFALRRNRVLLTEDKDFGRLFYSSSDQSPGVILIRFPGNARQAASRAVCDFVRVSAERIPGRFAVIQPGRIRISERP